MKSSSVAPTLEGSGGGEIKHVITSWGDLEVNKTNAKTQLKQLKDAVHMEKVAESFWIEIYNYKVLAMTCAVSAVCLGTICAVPENGLDPEVLLCVGSDYKWVAVGLYFGFAVLAIVLVTFSICNKQEIKVDPMREAMMYKIQYRNFQEAFDKAQFKKWDQVFAHVAATKWSSSDLVAGCLIIITCFINATNINYNFLRRSYHPLADNDEWAPTFYAVTWTEELVMMFSIVMILVRAFLCTIDRCKKRDVEGRRLIRLASTIHTVSTFSLLRGLSMRHTAYQKVMAHRHKKLDLAVVVPLMIAYFVFGMLAMFIKIIAIANIVNESLDSWGWADYVTLLAFYNNVLSIVDVKGLRKHAILLVSFGGENAELEEDEMHAVSEFFYRLASNMVGSGGFLGFLRFMQLDGKDLQKWLYEDHDHARSCSYEITKTTEVNQTIFVCRDCSDIKGRITRKMAKQHGVCMSCRYACHEGHDIVKSHYSFMSTYCSCGDGQFSSSCKIMNCVAHVETHTASDQEV